MKLAAHSVHATQWMVGACRKPAWHGAALHTTHSLAGASGWGAFPTGAGSCRGMPPPCGTSTGTAPAAAAAALLLPTSALRRRLSASQGGSCAARWPAALLRVLSWGGAARAAAGPANAAAGGAGCWVAGPGVWGGTTAGLAEW